MKIHEYQAKEILRGFGVVVPRGKLAKTAEEAVAAARELLASKPVCVVKAQIHAGGRGKGGGVKLAWSAEEAGKIAPQMVGIQPGPPQPGPPRLQRRACVLRRRVRNQLAAPSLAP